MNKLLHKIVDQLAQHLRTEITLLEHQALFGGDINQSFQLITTADSFFIKLNKKSRLPMFEAEAAALQTLSNSNTLRVPTPILAGSADHSAFLVMEYITMGNSSAKSEEALGHGLAAMHQTTNPQFGWSQDNTIGTTPQLNHTHLDWATFWREQRIAPQLQWATEKGASASLRQKGEQLLDHMIDIVGTHAPFPSLLHGDLWGGNWSTAKSGEPVIYDPALYYGDRETDLAMTELFGGFSSRFYDAYNESWPLDASYPQRKNLYNLYHILNHFNLFGGGYGRQAERMIDTLLKP